MHPAGHLVRRKSHNGGLYRVSRTQPFIVILHRNLAFFQTLCGAVREKLNKQTYRSGRNEIDSKSIWQQCHVGSNPTVCAKSSTLRGAAFYFCGKLCKGCKVGFEQPVPGALRPAGLQQSCGLLQGRGRIPPPAPIITTQVLHWVVIFYCRFVKFPYFSYKHLPFIFK